MRAIILHDVNGKVVASDPMDAAALVSFMAARNAAFIEHCSGPRWLPEVQGQPRFEGFRGPDLYTEKGEQMARYSNVKMDETKQS